MTDPIKTRTEADAINEIIRDSQNRVVPDDKVGAALSTGIIVFQDKSILNLETLQRSPKRKRARVKVYDVASFIHYVKDHKIDGQTAVFVNTSPTSANFCAIIDYHGTGDMGPAWGEHVCELELRTTHEWQVWTGSNNKLIGQEAFSEFLLDNRRDIVRPDAGILLDVARLLCAKKSVDFKSGINLKNGANHLEFVETIETRGISNRVEDAMDIPDTFMIGIIPFSGGAHEMIEAQLRFRIIDRKLSFVYVLLQPHKIVEAAIDAARAKVEAELEFVYYGGAAITPPPSLGVYYGGPAITPPPSLR